MDLSSYDVCVELDVVKCAFLAPTAMLLSLRTGEVYALRLHLSAAGAPSSSNSGGARFAGGGAPNRVVGQSMRPVGRASPCSVLAVSATVCGRSRDSDRIGSNGGRGGGAGGDGASTGLVFMGSRVGDSLLVKYAVASAGTQPGKRGKGAGGPAGLKRELKVEPEKEEWAGGGDRDGGRGGSANGVVRGDKGAAAEGGRGALSDSAGGIGRTTAVKEEPKEAAGLMGMDVDNSLGNGGGSGSGSSGDNPGGKNASADPPVGPVDASKEAAAAATVTDTATAATGVGGEGADAGTEQRPPATGGAPLPTTDTSATVASVAEADESPVAPPADGGKDVDCAAVEATATATATSTKKQPEAAQEKVQEEGDPGDGADSGGSSSSSSSGKRGRGEWSPSPGEGTGDDRDGAGVAADDDDKQPDMKRSRVSDAAAGDGNVDPAVPQAGTASPPHTAAAAPESQEGLPAATEGEGHSEPEAPDTGAENAVLSPENGGVVEEGIDAMDTTSPPPSAAPSPAPGAGGGVGENAEGAVGSGATGAADAAAEAAAAAAANFYGEDEETTKLIKEELEMIEEEEELYGARLGSSLSVGARGSRGLPLASLGSRAGERVIEAVGFRLKVGV